MTSEHEFQAERAELETVLSSGVLGRSLMLAQMLRYVCECHFRGESHQIKEYNIAVEALGRPADFDQARDSIIRVEAHRLRKRLQEYYQHQGKDHAVQIMIVPGNYVPQFLRKASAAPPADAAESLPAEAVPPSAEAALPCAEAVPLSAEAEPPSAETAPAPDGEEDAAKPAPAPVGRWTTPIRLGLVALGVVALGVLAFVATRARQRPGTMAEAAKGAFATDLDEVRILTGFEGARFTDHFGNRWSADRYHEGGEARVVQPRPILYTQDPGMFYHRRQGNFTYHIPLKKGVYEMRLYFAETVFGENNVGGGGETTRVFRIRANGVELQRYLDVISDIGTSNAADVKVFKDVRPSGDGRLHLEFLTVNNEVPFLNAIEIVPSHPGALRPIRILARESGYTDLTGRSWSADRYFRGGQLVQRHDAVAGAEDPALYQNERYGNFSYVIPVALGTRYTVNMLFCESWFGSDRPAAGGIGGRLFDISFNGRLLAGNFDVFREAGGLRALTKTFHGLEPNAQGKLIFSFTPSENYAMVDGIEILDEAWK